MKRLLVVLSVFALVALLGVAVMPVGAQDCTDEIGCVELGPDDPITVAYMLTISGGTASLGEDSLGAIEVAIDDRDGELLGHEIELVGEDSLCSAEGGQAAGQRIAANPQVLGIIGSNCSSEAVAALPIISEAGMLMISPSNTSPRLTETDPDKGGVWEPGYYRTAHNDLFQGAIAADFAYNILGKTKLATVHDGSPYAESLQAVMADTFTELGGEVVFQGAVNVGDTDMSAILTDISASGAEIIYFPIFQPESEFFTVQARETPGLEEVTLMGADASFADTFPENTGEPAVGKFLSGPYVAESEAYDAFLARWDEVVGGVPPSGFHAHAYDATNILLNAIEAVAVVADDGSISVGRQALRDYISGLTDYPGLTGNLTCNETGDCATGEALAVFEVTQAEVDGNWPPPVVWLPGMDAMMEPGS
ncbi:MAG: branched-chain amino acid ABC transporter substrate-binding protein [Anaerolineae bacterium]|nr:branched-chain amino acid ABC transporter substrate-binding protein [Anaerolineae bacterium]